MIINAAVKAGLSKIDLQALAGWLAELLVSQQFAKLSEGGHINNAISLRNIFIDLPAADDVTSTDSRCNIVETLESAPFIKAKDLLSGQTQIPGNPSINDELEEARLYKRHNSYQTPGSLSAVLLIGGPGQGKSTVGQLLSQLHRAKLLNGYRGLDKSQKEAVDDYARKRDGDVSLGRTTATLPIQINLPEFAAWLSKGARDKSEMTASLAIRYICQTPSAQAHDLKPSAILNASRGMKIQLVLDGFDEVGSQSERMRLVAECRNLIADFSEVSADIRVLVTTRPQGYTEEFEKIGFNLKKLYLLQLKVDEALVYAHRLIKEKILSADGRSRAREQINNAVNEPATKRLFTTPLQITIITALVQQMGNAPRERWNLFAGYFDYTYKREVERQTFASTLLRDQRQNIEQMHARVGLILQVRSELDGGASSRMTRPELEAIIDDILEAEEIAVEKKNQLISDIATAAEDRLVFLTQPEPENYGFEVRSLQEFFAAWALTTGPQADVETRLNRICRASAFKNVYLFSASRIFGSIPSLRDAWISQVCRWYDNPSRDKFGAQLKLGSKIALETLEEGVADNQPKYSKILMTLAATLLDLPAGKEHVRLAHACTPDNKSQLEAAIYLFLQDSDNAKRVSAWVVLLECINLKADWPEKCAEKFFVRSEFPIIRKAITTGLIGLNSWLAHRIQENLSDFDADEMLSFRYSSDSVTWLGQLVSKALVRRHRSWWNSPVKLNITSAENWSASFRFTGHKSWDAFISWMNFELSPSSETLAVACEKLEHLPPIIIRSLVFRCSWPLTAILKTCASANDFSQIAQHLRDGLLGNIGDWVSAESSWKVDVAFEKIATSTHPHLPWDPDTIAIAPPLQAFAHHSRLGDLMEETPKVKLNKAISKLISVFSDCRQNLLKGDCADLLLTWYSADPKRFPSVHANIEGWIEHSDRAGFYVFNRIALLPADISQKMLLRVEKGSYCGPPNALAEAIVLSNGDPLVISLATESLKTHFELVEIESEESASASFSKASELVRTKFQSIETLDLLIWNIAEEIRAKKLDLRDKDPEEIGKLGPYIVSVLLRTRGLLEQFDAEQFALALLDSNPQLAASSVVMEAIQEICTRRLSDLSTPAVWTSLHTGFYLSSSEESEAGSFSDISSLRSLDIENIRGISELHHTFAEVNDGAGQFVVLIGENGAGKTTILRAIALALRDASDLSIWPSGAFSAAWRSDTPNNSSPGKIKVVFGNDSSIETTITSAGQFKQSASSHRTRRPVFAYGCYRGSALGSTHGSVGLGEDGGPSIATLFDAEAKLINAESWLIQLEARSLKEANRSAAFDTVIQALCRLLGLRTLQIRSGNLYAETDGGQTLPFSALSDGYLSMSGWFIDVVARWVEYLDKNDCEISEDFLSKAQCYILIDEIDAHIHPGWQLDVIYRAKTIFPKCVFFVTTHNPLTLAGASPHEILQLKRVGRTVELIKGAMPPILLTGGQLYKQYFGIEQVIPTEVARLIGKKLTLEANLHRSEAEEKELSDTVSSLDRLELQGWEHAR